MILMQAAESCNVICIHLTDYVYFLGLHGKVVEQRKLKIKKSLKLVSIELGP